MRIVTLALSGIAVAALVGGARANGSIDTTGAVISLGVAPDQGTLTTNAGAAASAAPSIPSLASHGTLGTFSSPLPAFAGGGTGNDGAFVGAANQTLPGGTYNFTQYHVNAGVTVTYSGPVTILTTGDASVDGAVFTNSANAPITIRCAGTFTLAAGAGVDTNQASSPVTIDVGGAFTGATGASVSARGADVELTTHGLGGSNGAISLSGTSIRTFESSGVRVRAAGALTASGASYLSGWSGDVLLQAFGGNATFSNSARVDASDVAQTLTVEASGSVVVTGDGTRPQLYGGFGLCTVKAFGGDVEFLGATQVIAGPIRVAASGNVRVGGTSFLSISGDLTLTAFGGDVAVSATGGGHDALLAVEDIRIGATGNVVLSGGGTIRAAEQVDLRAPAGSVSATTGVTIGLAIDNFGSISISAGAGGINLGGAAVFSNSTLGVTALGPVVIGGAVGARSHVTVTSCDAGVDLSGATFHTLATSGVSGDITVQSFGDAAGVIDAAGVSFQTDAATTKSGDVNLLVHLAKTNASPEPVSIDSFFLPKSVTVKTDAVVPSKSKVTISGVLDEGSGTPDYTAASTLEVGNASFPISGMIAKGRSFEFAAPGIFFRVTPAKTASSRSAFLIVRTGDPAGEVDKDGDLKLRLFAPGFDAVGIAKLVAGKFKLGKVRGGLIIPCVFPQSVAAVLKGAGKDKFSLVAGFALVNYTAAIGGPGDIPSVTIAVGGTFTATIDSASFVASKKGNKVTFKGNVNGITNVVVDLTKETIAVKGSKMSLVGVTAASGPVAVTITLDTPAHGIDTRTVTVSLDLSGTSLKY